jgi:hypothetical protein
MSAQPATPERFVTVISDGFALEVACTDGKFDAVVEALQGFLMALDVDMAVMIMESGSAVAEQVRDAERTRRAAARN